MKKTILVVDDELGYRDMLRMDLTGQGFNVFTARCGMEALEVLKKEKIDLVVMDMKMPHMDGLDTVVAIKKTHARIPIVLITGYAVEDRVEKVLQLTETTCLRKPFDMDELTSVIQTALPA